MLEFLSSVFYYLTFDFGAYAVVLALSLLLANAVVFLLEVTAILLFKVNRECVYFSCFSLICLILSAYFSLQDYFGEKVLFLDFKTVYAFLTVYSVLILTFFASLKKLSVKKVKQINDAIIEKPEEEILSVSNATRYFKKDEIFSGYLDVSYVKQLIAELKTKQLSESDYQAIEELEVYLLRFTTRQPNEEERIVLSEYLSMLIKKLAIYA